MLMISFSFAQSPQGINYQAVARNTSGAILSNQTIGVRISICMAANGSLPVYVETHSVTTNQFGLFTLNIGNGTPTLGTFSAIQWGALTPYLKVQMDATGGTNYVLMGISQLLSVPYALYSLNTGYSDSTKWSLNGNANTDSTNFIGTTDAQDLKFQVNNIPAGYISGGATTTENLSLGLYAGNNSSGNSNTAIGFGSLQNNTIGFHNTVIGAHTFFQNFKGSDNTFLGYFSDSNPDSCTGVTAIGTYAHVNAMHNATALGYAAYVNADNKVRIGDLNVTVVESQVGSWTTSDGRFKTNVTEEVKGLQFIKKLHPVIYNFDTKKFDEFLMQNMPDSIKQERMKGREEAYARSSNLRHNGFIAQEVEQAAKECNYDFGGVHHPENADDNWSLSYENFVVPLVKAVQEQQKEIEEQRMVIKEMRKEIEGMKNKIK